MPGDQPSETSSSEDIERLAKFFDVLIRMDLAQKSINTDVDNMDKKG